MELLENILSQDMVQRLGWMLVHFVWQAAMVALVLAILLKLLRKSSANLRYIVACLALVAVVLLPAVTMSLIPVDESYSEAEAAVVPAPVPAPIPAPAPAPAPAPVAIISTPAVIEPPANIEMLVTEPELPVQSIAASPQIPLRQRIAEALEPKLPYVVMAWFVGVLGLSVWYLGGWAQLRKLRQKMVKPVDECWRGKLKELAGILGVNRAVQIMESALVQSPTVIGWLKPVILLSASVLTGFSTDQIEAILAHELAHIKRCDYLVNMLQTGVEILGFYHPAVWWISKKIKVERENCCDDIAVKVNGDRIGYAKTLALFDGIKAGQPDLAVAASGGSLFERICRLIQKDSTNIKADWMPSVIVVLLIISLLIPAGFALTARSEEKAAVAVDVTGEDEDSGLSRAGVNIYLLEDENMDLRTALKKPISQLVLRKKPWISSDDILRYDTSSHCIHLKKNIKIPLKKRLLRGNPFIVTVDGQRCYLGALWSHGSSFLPEAVPLIYSPNYHSEDMVTIESHRIYDDSGNNQAQDVRNDPRILKSLRDNGQYHGGLNLLLDNIEVLRKDNDFSVSYTYTLTNKDKDNLYVFDPAKMGTGLFHFFTNGLGLYSPDRKVDLGPDLKKVVKKPEKSDKIDMAWFSLLKSGESMTRTVILGGYPEILPDKYECSFIFHSPSTRKLSKDQLQQADGRIWTGQIGANLKTSVQVEGEKRRERVKELFGLYVRGEQLPKEDSTGGLSKHPKLTWPDIPILLQLARSERVLKGVPKSDISSYLQEEGREGMVALWLIDALLKKQVAAMMELQGANGRLTNHGLGLNPICVKPNMTRQECENLLEIHQEVLELYRRWWSAVGVKTPGEAAIFCPLELSDIQWVGRQRWENWSDIEIFKKVTDAGVAGQRIIRELEYHKERREYRPGKKARTIYYALKQPALQKAPFTKEMLKVQKIVLHFYDDKGRNIRNKVVFPSAKASEDLLPDSPNAQVEGEIRELSENIFAAIRQLDHAKIFITGTAAR